MSNLPGLFGYRPEEEPSGIGTARKRRFYAAIVTILAGCAFGVVWPSAIKAIRFRFQPGIWDYVATLLCPVIIFIGFLLIPSAFTGKFRKHGALISSLGLGTFCMVAGILIALMFHFFYVLRTGQW